MKSIKMLLLFCYYT